jgi:hypothetical protein
MCLTATIFNRGEDRGSLKTLVNLASFCQNRVGLYSYNYDDRFCSLRRAASNSLMANLRRDSARRS